MDKPKYNILYVDDEEINLRIFGSTFEDDFNIFTATSGDEGLRIIRENRIDLIITDQRMPGMTGVEFLKQAIDLNPEPNRILLTGFSDIDALSKAVNDGKIFQYINKPWDEHELKPVINQAIESYYIKRENLRLTKELQEKAGKLEKEMTKKTFLLEQVRQSEQELKVAKEKAEESDRLKTAFLQNMSHEIRTPLNGIVGYADLLAEMVAEDSSVSKFTSIIVKCSDQLLSIVNDILDISRIDTGQLELNTENFNISGWLREFYDVFSPAVGEKKLGFVIDNKLSDNLMVNTDRLRLTQIVNNLMNNAIKFTKTGQIILGCTWDGQRIVVFVKDTGIGIRPDLKNKIFDRFIQAELEMTKNFGGTGLGLSIAKGLADLLQLKLWYDSELDAGSAFYLSIPIADDKIPDKGTNETISEEIKDQKPGHAHQKILVAEDEDTNFDYIQELMSCYGFEILHALDGNEAIDYCKKFNDIDLVLMDIKMPNCNGIEATRVIKEDFPHLPIIAVTAFAMHDDRQKFINEGFDDYFPKPLRRDNINMLIGKYL
nr:response regulator [Bacteroidota bacterium]